MDIRITEYSGLDQSNPFDTASSASGNSNIADSGSQTTSSTNELIFGAGMTQGGFGTAGTGFTMQIITSPDADIVEDKLTNTGGAYNASASVSGNWVMQMATFKSVPTTPTPTPTVTPTPTDTPIPTATPTPVPTHTISGTVYTDTNSNGAKDVNENGYSGAIVSLSSGSSTQTDLNGNYTFSNVIEGSYQVTLTIPSGLTATTTNPVSVSVLQDTTVNFGIAPTPTESITPTDTPIVTPTPTPQPNGYVYPLKTGPTGRYLVDQNNVPFFMVGDSPQALIGNISESDADYYFANRQKDGFNTVWINLLCNSYTFCNSDGTTFDGIKPFTTPGDLSTPNPTYFTKVDHIIQLAAKYNLLVMLDPIETGGWYGIMQNNGTTKDFNYGAFLGNRYKSYPNIIWMSGNDYQGWGTSEDPYVTAVAKGIQSVDSTHLQTIELNYNQSSSLDDQTWVPILGLNATYSYYPTYDQTLHSYHQTPTMPTFLVEGHYEDENVGPGTGGTPQVLRRQAYWETLSGGIGQIYGSFYTDRFDSAWKTNLDLPGALQLPYWSQVFTSRAWYTLVPDETHTVLTAGYGTYNGGGDTATNDYATVARTPDGTLVMVYMPTKRTITIDMTKLSGSTTAQWYDPTKGTYQTVSGSPFPNTGLQQFTPPGNNAGGDSDWVLVLEATPGPTPTPCPACPTPTPTPTPVLTPKFVQQSYVTPQSFQSQLSVTFNQAQTAGNTNIIVVGWNDTTSSISSVTDSSGNTEQAAVTHMEQFLFIGQGKKAQAFYTGMTTKQPPKSLPQRHS